MTTSKLKAAILKGLSPEQAEGLPKLIERVRADSAFVHKPSKKRIEATVVSLTMRREIVPVARPDLHIFVAGGIEYDYVYLLSKDSPWRKRQKPVSGLSLR